MHAKTIRIIFDVYQRDRFLSDEISLSSKLGWKLIALNFIL